jgi:hypothetical protein
VVLPHPIAGYKNKEEIFKLVGIVAGKEAAGENLDFGGDMWKMIEWGGGTEKGLNRLVAGLNVSHCEAFFVPLFGAP